MIKIEWSRWLYLFIWSLKNQNQGYLKPARDISVKSARDNDYQLPLNQQYESIRQSAVGNCFFFILFESVWNLKVNMNQKTRRYTWKARYNRHTKTGLDIVSIHFFNSLWCVNVPIYFYIYKLFFLRCIISWW